MIKLSKKVMADIAGHAEECAPNECCGLLVRVGRKVSYHQCANIAADPQNHFHIDPVDYCKAEDAGTVIAIVHSHPDALPRPSVVDRLECEKHQLPWLIIGRDNETEWLEPTGYTAPLLGRKFVHGVLDCYQAISDFYAREFDINLGHYDREDGWWERQDGPSLYLDNFRKEGFVPVNSPQYGDILIMRIKTPGVTCHHPNHAAVFLGSDPQLKSEQAPTLYGPGPFFFHHLYGRLSTREIYGHSWANRTEVVLRHQSKM
jgi:proteasome lid subunit RPN8/RPN11